MWALAYLAAIVLAELLTLFSPPFGMAFDLVLMVALMFQASLASEQDRPLLVALVLIPLVRIVSLSFPLAPSPVAYRYLLTSIPLVVAGILVARNLGLSPGELGLGLGRSLHQLLIGFLSLPLGAIAYLIVRPAAIRSPVSWPTAVVIAVVLVVTTGFVEEFIYRGVLQTASRRVLGHWGLVYASTVSAAVYIGYRSVTVVAFMLAVSLGFAWLVARGGSLLGVSLAHGFANVGLLLVLPLAAGQGGLSVT